MADIPDIATRLVSLPRAARAVLVTDSSVDGLFGDAVVRQLEDAGLRVERIVFPAGERSKTLETYAELVRGFAALGLTRTDFAIALGGGVVGDLTGFAAATYMRGIDFVQVPTTLLAMVDSSIGGKTGVDIPEGKNLVGAFRLPKQIVCDTGFLRTLPEKELMNGLAEMIKTAVLFDRDLFAELGKLAGLDPAERLSRLGPLVARTAAWKEKVVAEDFKEGGRRKLLNLGHTFGHALERASDFRLAHGEAVAVGMRIVGRDVPEIGAMLDAYGYLRLACGPQALALSGGRDPAVAFELDRAQVLEGVAMDKKRAGDAITLVVPREVGRCELVETPVAEVPTWLR
ncbi:MAG: 3-dehydroquinate synthase [Kiritimatiellia bacterium]